MLSQTVPGIEEVREPGGAPERSGETYDRRIEDCEIPIGTEWMEPKPVPLVGMGAGNG